MVFKQINRAFYNRFFFLPFLSSWFLSAGQNSGQKCWPLVTNAPSYTLVITQLGPCYWLSQTVWWRVLRNVETILGDCQKCYCHLLPENLVILADCQCTQRHKTLNPQTHCYCLSLPVIGDSRTQNWLSENSQTPRAFTYLVVSFVRKIHIPT
jgi:hypothetical protein